MMDEVEENNLRNKARFEKWKRWNECSLCEQKYHGVVRCALGWACWKTYVGWPEVDQVRGMAMGVLGGGLHEADHHEDALSVQEADLAMRRRIGGSADEMLIAQNNLAISYARVGRDEEALRMSRDVYSGRLNLDGEGNERTLRAANNYASFLCFQQRFQEARSLLRKTMPVARRVLGESSELALKMRETYAQSLNEDPGATLDDRREAVTTLEDTVRIARRVLGGAHPLTGRIELHLREARAALGTSEGDDVESIREGVDALNA